MQCIKNKQKHEPYYRADTLCMFRVHTIFPKAALSLNISNKMLNVHGELFLKLYHF